MAYIKTPPAPNAVTNFHVDHEWLALAAPEEILDPKLPIVDSHHHLLDRMEGRYLVPDLLGDVNQGHNIIGTVFVEGGNFFALSHGATHMRLVGETDIVASMTREFVGKAPGIAAGIVSYANLFEGKAIGDVLDAHIEAGQGRFAGIRQLVIWDDHEEMQMHVLYPRREIDAGMMKDPKFRDGYAELASRNLVFDATAYHHQLPELYDLAKSTPDVTLVLDHLCNILQVGPYEGQENEIFDNWVRDMSRISELENVVVKIGGLGMRMYGFKLRDLPKPAHSEKLAELWRPYVETAIEIFGPERCMFESNFPVDKGYFSYTTCWNAFKRITEGASTAEKQALFSQTAIKTYGLKL